MLLEKNVLKDLLNPGLQQTFNLLQKKKKVLSVKCNKAKCNKLGTPVIDVK